MAMFRKKPVVIEAIQLNWQNWNKICDFCQMPKDGFEGCYVDADGKPTKSQTEIMGLIIPTLEGNHLARQNDWIIKGVNGEYYPCKPDIFEKTYEPVKG